MGVSVAAAAAVDCSLQLACIVGFRMKINPRVTLNLERTKEKAAAAVAAAPHLDGKTVMESQVVRPTATPTFDTNLQ